MMEKGYTPTQEQMEAAVPELMDRKDEEDEDSAEPVSLIKEPINPKHNDKSALSSKRTFDEEYTKLIKQTSSNAHRHLANRSTTATNVPKEQHFGEGCVTPFPNPA